jgi:hypothetical protein
MLIQVFTYISWDLRRSWLNKFTEKPYPWLSARIYRLDEIEIKLNDMEGVVGSVQEISFDICSLALNHSTDSNVQFALKTLHLVECNPQLKRLTIADNKDNYSFNSRMFNYLTQRCPEINEIMFSSSTAHSVRLAMDIFPSLRKVICNSVNVFRSSSPKVVASYPKIDGFELIPFGKECSSFLPLIKACPNIKDLYCEGGLTFRILPQIIRSCRQLTSFGLRIVDENEVYGMVPLLSALAKYSSQLTELWMEVADYRINIQRGSETRNDLIRIIKRLRKFDVIAQQFITDDRDEEEDDHDGDEDEDEGNDEDEEVEGDNDGDEDVDEGDARGEDNEDAKLINDEDEEDSNVHADDYNNDGTQEFSICSLFSSPDVDLRFLNICTEVDTSDMIVKMLHGCRNIEKLVISGYADGISTMMMKISANSHRIVDLLLGYGGLVDGKAMKALLQSCHQLTSLGVTSYLDLQAYENLALYGGNLTKLELGNRFLEYPRTSLSFSANSPLYDPNFKQQRKHMMSTLECDQCDLHVMSFAKFLSCFELIDELAFRLDSSQLPVDVNIDTNDVVPPYHACRVSISCWWGSSGALDSVFSAIMSSCQHLRELKIGDDIFSSQRDRSLIEASTLIRVVCECSERNHALVSLSCANVAELSPLRELLPKLKLKW